MQYRSIHPFARETCTIHNNYIHWLGVGSFNTLRSVGYSCLLGRTITHWTVEKDGFYYLHEISPSCSYIYIHAAVVTPRPPTVVLQPEGPLVLCPRNGSEVMLTCTTRGSNILYWSSDCYIEPGGTQLELATFNAIGDTRISPINSNTVATLTNKSIDNGEVVLESELHFLIDLGSNCHTSSITCSTSQHNKKIMIPVSSKWQILFKAPVAWTWPKVI